MNSPRFPPELERHIFELASLEDQISIVLVSRRAYEWIFPLQFHCLVFTLNHIRNDFKNLTNFMGLLKSKPSGFFAPHVNKLLLQTPTDVKAAPTLLPAFSSLQWLAIWSIEDDSHVFNMILGLLELKRLSLGGEIKAFFETIRNEQAVLPKLTHLDVECLDKKQHPDANCIIRLQSLTHLSYAFDGDIPKESLRVVLTEASALRVLVIVDVLESLSEDDRSIFESDLRVVLVRDTFVGDYVDDWTAHEKGQPDFWDRAEDIIASRRPTGDIKNQSLRTA